MVWFYVLVAMFKGLMLLLRGRKTFSPPLLSMFHS